MVKGEEPPLRTTDLEGRLVLGGALGRGFSYGVRRTRKRTNRFMPRGGITITKVKKVPFLVIVRGFMRGLGKKRWGVCGN